MSKLEIHLRSLSVLAGVFLLVPRGTGAGGAPPTASVASSSPTAEIQAVLSAEKSRREAVVERSLAKLAAMTAEDLIYVDAHGIERNKPAYLEHIATENVRYVSYSLEHPSVRIEGTVAIVRGIFQFDVMANGRSHKGSHLYTAVYVREGAAWKLLVWHPTTNPSDN